ncbi:hypothetical protein GUJ93_ZPchr0011g27634 [Zizania palustris]|nr:hypothetical protein GUJ93_ZPchr0011g27634 [Zizania palustris]
MASLLYWIARNPPPVHFFLMSGNKGFASILHRLRMNNYNVLLACPSADSSVLCSAATIMWPWDALVKGMDLSPKHFNQAPDGIFFSRYGHYRGPLDDPFLNSESEDSIALPPNTNPVKPPTVPKSIANGVKQALYSFPEGISLPDLRAELKKNHVFMDKGLFGFKQFSSLLEAMPGVVKFIDPLPGESQPVVVGVFNRSLEPSEQSCKGMNYSQSGEVKRFNETLNGKLPPSHVPSFPSDLLSTDHKVHKKNPTVDVPSSLSDSLSRGQRKAPPVDLIMQSETPASCMEAGVESAAGTPSFSAAQSNINKRGLFERISMLWNFPETIKPILYPSQDATLSRGSNDLRSQERHNNDQQNNLLKRTLKNFSRTDSSDGKNIASTSSSSSSFSNISANGHSGKLNVKENLGNMTRSVNMSKAEHKDGFAEKSKGIFSWAATWWTSGKLGTDDNISSVNIIDGTRKESEKKSAFVETSATASGQQVGSGQGIRIKMLKEPVFWDALHQYLSTPDGSDLVSKAITREELAHGLHKQGCWDVTGLDGKHIHQLVDLLISEKKWIKESSSQMFPFLLTLPQRRTCAPLHFCISTGLTSISMNGRPSEQCKHVNRKGNENQTKGDDFVWEELGPLSGTGKSYQEIDKGVYHHPSTHPDDEFCDDENHEVHQKAAGRDAGQSETQNY